MKSALYLIITVLAIAMPAGSFALQTGDRAPLFNAESTYGTISLQHYYGKKNVVLAFYYKDFTPA